jgi:hypothetical protein
VNRAARRAFAQNLSKALGREKAHRPAEDPTEVRLRRLEQENAALKEQVAGLENRHDQVPGVASHRKDWYVLVGGERVDLKAIPPAEWLRTLEELPQFLFAFALQKTEGKALDGETLEQITDLAKRWIAACAVEPDELQLDRLTLPEAEHAVAHIAELNGVTAHLRAWFRKRLAGVAAAAPGSEELRDAPERPAGDLPN